MVPSKDATDGHLSAMLEWLGAVRAALGETVPRLVAEETECMAALTVKVRPDQAGIATSTELVKWAQPALVLEVPPTEDSSDFVLTLLGERDIEIVCGPPLDRPTPRALREIDPDVRETVDEALTDLFDVIESREPEWEPVLFDEALEQIVGRCVADLGSSVDAETIRSVLLRGSGRGRLDQLLVERKTQHRNAWARNARSIATALLAGDDGDALREGRKPARVALIHEHLMRQDPHCATKTAAEPIADAIARLLG